jgi:CubicO group peptidase (beta-lactamase class C family)
MKTNSLLLFLFILLVSCGSNDDNPITEPTVNEEEIYFPVNGSTTWDTKTPESLSWKINQIQPLYDFLALKNSKSFIVLHNGKIVLEKYFGTHTATTPWYWASAGKTLTSTVTGIAEQEGFLSTSNKVSTYLGNGWTSAPLAKENLITCKSLLTMTSGLNDALGDSTTPANLQYVADAGTRWAYHNVYVKLQDVVANATNQTWTNYFNTKLRDKIGMTGSWINANDLNIYWSDSRSMARFGLLAFAKGKWNGNQIVNSNYLTFASSASQNINPSYGYLWWLNGKEGFKVPQSQIYFNGSLIPNAPNDMYCALGKNDQKIYIVPSKKLVIIRMGNEADASSLAITAFDNDLWSKINAVIN